MRELTKGEIQQIVQVLPRTKTPIDLEKMEVWLIDSKGVKLTSWFDVPFDVREVKLTVNKMKSYICDEDLQWDNPCSFSIRLSRIVFGNGNVINMFQKTIHAIVRPGESLFIPRGSVLGGVILR